MCVLVWLMFSGFCDILVHPSTEQVGVFRCDRNEGKRCDSEFRCSDLSVMMFWTSMFWKFNVVLFLASVKKRYNIVQLVGEIKKTILVITISMAANLFTISLWNFDVFQCLGILFLRSNQTFHRRQNLLNFSLALRLGMSAKLDKFVQFCFFMFVVVDVFCS